MTWSFLRVHKLSIVTFVAGVGLAVLFLVVPSLHKVIIEIDQLGYFGMLVGGVMYGSALTASTATLIFVGADYGLNPILVGLIGGLGAAIYDTTIFLIIRHESDKGFFARWLERLRAKFHVPTWVDMLIGGFIMASPLPDELAAGLMGATNGKTMPFLMMSFAANAIGIMLLSRL